jgi:hypothetical protein
MLRDRLLHHADHAKTHPLELRLAGIELVGLLAAQQSSWAAQDQKHCGLRGPERGGVHRLACGAIRDVHRLEWNLAERSHRRRGGGKGPALRCALGFVPLPGMVGYGATVRGAAFDFRSHAMTEN